MIWIVSLVHKKLSVFSNVCSYDMFQDLDDLEADLFKPKKATGKKTPPTREKTEPKESPRATEKIGNYSITALQLI